MSFPITKINLNMYTILLLVLVNIPYFVNRVVFCFGKAKMAQIFNTDFGIVNELGKL